MKRNMFSFLEFKLALFYEISLKSSKDENLSPSFGDGFMSTVVSRKAERERVRLEQSESLPTHVQHEILRDLKNRLGIR